MTELKALQACEAVFMICFRSRDLLLVAWPGAADNDRHLTYPRVYKDVVGHMPMYIQAAHT